MKAMYHTLVVAGLFAATSGFASGLECMLYWKGWVFSAEKGICEERGASGCTNPFPYETESQCWAAQGEKK